MSNLKKFFIVIPSINPQTAVCDVVEQTAKELSKDHFVIIVQVREGKSLKEIVSGKNYSFLQKINSVNYLTPIDIVPFKRFHLIKEINLFLNLFALQLYVSLRKNQLSCIIWNFFPHAQHINNYFFLRKKIIFDIVDYFTSPTASTQNQLEQNKANLLKKASYVFSISETLKRKYQKIYNRDITLVPQGFDLDNFKKNKHLIYSSNSKDILQPSNKSKQKIIGFVGGINDRLDYGLLKKVIKANQNILFVFCGPITEDENISGHVYPKRVKSIMTEKNVVHIPRQRRESLLSIISKFDICMIPYDTRYQFNKYSYPMKVFEYFYAGKPVVSTPISELKSPRFNELIYLGKNVQEWNKHISALSSQNWPKNKSKIQQKMAMNNTWLQKVHKILKEIE